MTIDDINPLIQDAVSEVFTTMLSMNVELAKPEMAAMNGEAHIASAVGFIGRMTGVVYLYSSGSFARTMTGQLLGLTDAEVDGDEMVNDAVGELANMVVGHVKSRLADRGMPCVLTIPSIVRGSHFSIEPVRSTERRVFVFRSPKGNLIVEVLIKSAGTANKN
jgi:chemotaxis protein CheX